MSKKSDDGEVNYDSLDSLTLLPIGSTLSEPPRFSESTDEIVMKKSTKIDNFGNNFPVVKIKDANSVKPSVRHKTSVFEDTRMTR